jgi:ribosome biogenesis GTPase
MSKRKLSKQQQSRIAQNQQSRQTQKSPPNESPESNQLGPECSGLVISHFGQQLEVESTSETNIGQLYRCYQRSNLPRLVTGDNVIWQQDGPNSGVIVALDSRQNVLSRPNSLGELKPIASNIDLVMAVIAPVPEPFMNMVDRYLVAIECLKLQPILVVNKLDLINPQNRANIDNMISIYEKIGYPVFQVSAQDGAGIDSLMQALKSRTGVFVGQSGVGKSSLINALGAEFRAETGALSVGKEKGTHTTTTSRLFHLKDCNLIDSPGIRDFSLWHIDDQQLFDGFIEFAKFTGQCKFRDCSHQSEPGCALLAAAEKGEIFSDRLESYLHIKQSLASR